MIRIKFKLNPKENQKDAALLYFADRTGMNVRDFIYTAAQERTAQLAQQLSEEIKKAQSQQTDKEESNDTGSTGASNNTTREMNGGNDDASTGLQTTESQSVQSSGASEQEAVDDTRPESSEG